MDQTSIYVCLVWIAVALSRAQESEDAKIRCASFFQGMAVQVVEFSKGRYKIRKVFAKESNCSKKMIEF